MRELHETEKAPQKPFLIGIRDGTMEDWEAESLTKELGSLAKTLGLNIVGHETVRIRGKNAQYGMGTGKADEITEAAKALDADCLIFDTDISPTQQRNWEKLTGIPAIDRQEVIIQIFANRAKTREAELQIELALLAHSLPRLSHKYIDLSRQRGGRYGTKGSGETKLELDRRTVQRRIHQLEEELLEVRKQRATQRKRRERVPIPSCALAGYTNAGKSSLLNGMTKAQVLVEDKLFATLDSTTRRVEIRKGQPILLTDTVGFIRRLPHELVDAFHSTLEEVTLADLLVQVLDASDPEVDRHFDVTMTVIKELGAEKTPMILALNKIDRIESPEGLEALRQRYTDGVFVSALTGQGLDDLARRIDLSLSGPLYQFQFPPNRHDLVALLHRTGTVITEQYTDNRIYIEARVGDRVLGTLKEWLQEPAGPAQS